MPTKTNKTAKRIRHDQIKTARFLLQLASVLWLDSPTAAILAVYQVLLQHAAVAWRGVGSQKARVLILCTPRLHSCVGEERKQSIVLCNIF